MEIGFCHRRPGSRRSGFVCRGEMFVLLSAAASLLAATNAWAIVTQNYGPFSVDFYNTGDSFTDSTGSYTAATTWTSEQMADIGAAISVWDAKIANTPGRQINLDVIWTSLSDNTLGGSYSEKRCNGTRIWNAAEGIWRDGMTTAASAFDTRIVYDIDAAGSSWNFGSGTPSSNAIDFRSVVTHELGHSLGFDSTYNLTTSDVFSDDSYGISIWDSYLIDENGNAPEAGSTGSPGNFDEVGNVYFTGSAARAANNGQNIAIYAPSPYEEGSSLAHLDSTTALMSRGISTGVVHREPTDVEWAMMTDMGWTIVPEPTVWTLILGAVIPWFVCWRRRSGPARRV